MEKIYHNETIPTISPASKQKWDCIDLFLSESHSPIYISHKHESDITDNTHMFFNAIIWGSSDDRSLNEILNEGSYAYFSFTGSKEDYKNSFMMHI